MRLKAPQPGWYCPVKQVTRSGRPREARQYTAPDGDVHVGQSLMRGPIERDRDSGSCRIEVRLARGRLRSLLRMRLDIDFWSSSSTVLELTPPQRVRPTATYFHAGHRLLDCLIHSLAVCVRNRSMAAPARPHQAGAPQPCAAQATPAAQA